MDNLTQKDNFILTFENSVKECWNKAALDDFRTSSITYGELAAEIETNVLFWKAAGLKKDDRIAINAKSSSNWAKIFLSSQVGEFVSVQIFPGFTPADTANMVNHSETRVLYTEKAIFEHISFEDIPEVIGVIDIKSGELLASRGNFAEAYANRAKLFSEVHPDGLKPEDIHYPDRPLDSLAAIMYTSGSTGNPKGVMLTNRNFTANIYLIPKHFPYRREDNYVSVLPFAHIFGMVYDMLAPLCFGMHLVVLCLPPVPAYLKPALAEFKPHVFFAVPLILTKLIEDTIGEFIHSKTGAAKLADYKNNPDFCKALSIIFMEALGGNVGLFVTGGAAIPEQFEKLFVEQLNLPFVTGYGMTEAAPTICLGHKGKYKLKECGEYPRRNPHQGPRALRRILQERGGHQSRVHRRRMVPYRRPRHHGQGPQRVHRGAQQEHDPDPQRPEHLSRGDRSRAQRPARSGRISDREPQRQARGADSSRPEPVRRHGRRRPQEHNGRQHRGAQQEDTRILTCERL